MRAGQKAVDVHVADSLSGLEIAELSAADRIADLGSGAGFPGLVLAAVLEGAQVDLIDSTARKGDVAGRLAQRAQLENVRPVVSRAEDWAAGEGGCAYAAATARALAPLAVILEYAAPLLRLGGSLVAYKGSRDPDEETAAGEAGRVLGMEARGVRAATPFSGSRDRHLHHWVKAAPTPDRFPRRAGMARKRPLA